MKDYFKNIIHPYRLLCTAIYGIFLTATFLFLYFLAFFAGMFWPPELLGGAICFSFLVGWIIARDDLKFRI